MKVKILHQCDEQNCTTRGEPYIYPKDVDKIESRGDKVRLYAESSYEDFPTDLIVEVF